MIDDLELDDPQSYYELFEQANQVDTTGFDEEQLREYANFLDDCLVKAARENFYVFATTMAPVLIPGEFKNGVHIRIICKELQEVFESIVSKEKKSWGKKLRISVSPGSMKTLLGSILFPAWCLGRDPTFRILCVSHSTKHAERFIGKIVRNLINTDEYNKIFPKVSIQKDSKAAGFWATSKGGYLGSFGVGAHIAGKRANLTVTDDIVSEQSAYSKVERDGINQWYIPGLRTRLLPGGGEISILCLTGDTPILMSDGSWCELHSVRENDYVLTWNNNKLERKRVLRSSFQGLESIYEVRTKNWVVKGNERHPFLVIPEEGKDPVWVQLKDLEEGMKIVCAAGIDETNTKNPFDITEEEAWLLGFMFGDGWVTRHPNSKGSMRWATCVAKGAYPEINQRVLDLFKKFFGREPKETKFGYYRFEIADAGRWFEDRGLTPGVGAKEKRFPKWIFNCPAQIRSSFLDGFIEADGCVGKKDNLKHISLCNRLMVLDAKILAQGLGFKVSNIHEYHGRGQPPNSPKPIDYSQYHISIGNKEYTEDFCYSRITSIEPAGFDEVFDVTVEDNENFIAGGLVVHNTRWHMDDVAGFIEEKDKDSQPWKTISIPAVLDRKTIDLYQSYEPDLDLTNYKVGGTYWPEYKPLDQLLDMKSTLPAHQWSSLYLQNPIPEDGSIYKSKYFKQWTVDENPEVSNIVVSLDTAYTEEDRRDASYSAYSIWGIFPKVERLFGGREKVVGNMILLGAEKGRWSFFELCQKCNDINEQYKNQIDAFIIEDQASGKILIPELRARGFPVIPYNPDKSKEARAWASSNIIEAGRVWINPNKKFTQEFMVDILQFPYGESKDWADTLSQAILFMRDNFHLILPEYMAYEYEPEDYREKYESKNFGDRPRTYWGAVQGRLN